MKTLLCAACAALALIVLQAGTAAAQERAAGKTLIAYYSRTGNTKLACEALAKALGADLLEIKDGTDRSGGWGFFTGAVNSLFGMHTAIEPEHPDLAAYGRIIVAGPIWAGKLAAATRTFLALNRLDGKKVALFATTNVPENESSRNKNIALAAKAGGAVLGYWQVAVTEKVDGKKVEIGADRIRQEALALAPDIRAAFEK